MNNYIHNHPYRLKDFIQFNPKEKLPKGAIARKITMEQLSPNNRYVESNIFEEYKGGSKFRNGDTIMARITPCLENGKTAYITSLNENELAFGSTEFIVFRKIEGKSNSKYIYYLLKTPQIRDIAIKSMVGSSGRQRVQQNVLENYEVLLPTLDKQIEIASILSSLDDKIELNRRINENLEQQAQALFKSWFIDFGPFKDGKFVDSELGMIPEELTISHIGDIPHTIESGRRPKGGAVLKGVPSIGAENIKGLGYYDYSKTKYIPEDFALTTNRGKINGYELLIYKDGGKPGYFIPNYTIFGEGFPFDEMFINEHVFRLDLMSKEYNVFAYFYMQTPYIMNQLNSIGGKAAIPGINTKDVESLPIFTEDNKKIKEFGNLVLPMITTILRNCHENARLAQLRDTLLPRLMSGKLEIKDNSYD